MSDKTIELKPCCEQETRGDYYVCVFLGQYTMQLACSGVTVNEKDLIIWGDDGKTLIAKFPAKTTYALVTKAVYKTTSFTEQLEEDLEKQQQVDLIRARYAKLHNTDKPKEW